MAQHADLPKEKQTDLGLYLTAQEAYTKWNTDPQKVKVLDVRTPEEYLFVGHADMARNIPIGFVAHQWNSEKNEPVFTPNTNFIEAVKTVFSNEDIILVTCRSGGRAAVAINALAKAGFKHVYNIIDGMEGDTVKDPASPDNGKRLKNGWKNSGLPWTYEINPDLLWNPKSQQAISPS